MKIIAIGGGEIGRPGFPVETTAIDKEILRLTGKKKPKLLFVPTASSDAAEYTLTIRNHFGERLGCEVSELLLLNTNITSKEIKKRIFASDIVYVGGGNTLKMLTTWRKLGLDRVLYQAGKRDIVLSGVSAGAICWFRFGSSDSRRFTNPKAHLIKVSGLNFIPALLAPHYDVEVDRKAHVKQLMKKTPGVAIALENCCAIEIINNQFRIITSKPGVKAYKVYWKKGRYIEESIKTDKFLPLATLLQKF